MDVVNFLLLLHAAQPLAKRPLVKLHATMQVQGKLEYSHAKQLELSSHCVRSKVKDVITCNALINNTDVE